MNRFKKNSGMSLVELMVGLGIGGIAMLLVGSLMTNFAKSNRAATSSAGISDITSVLSVALSNPDPTVCAQHVLLDPKGNALPLPRAPVAINTPISIHNDVVVNGVTKPFIIATPNPIVRDRGKLISIPDSDGNIITINLTAPAPTKYVNHVPEGIPLGSPGANIPLAESFVYRGSVVLNSTRINPKTNEIYGAPLTVNIPVTFEVNAANGQLVTCSSRLEETDIDAPAGRPPHSTSDCYAAGGAPMRFANNQLVCHFTGLSDPSQSFCPPAFTAPKNSSVCTFNSQLAKQFDFHVPTQLPGPSYSFGPPSPGGLGREMIIAQNPAPCVAPWSDQTGKTAKTTNCAFPVAGRITATTCPAPTYTRAVETGYNPNTWYCEYYPTACPPKYTQVGNSPLQCKSPVAPPTPVSDCRSISWNTVPQTNPPSPGFNCD